ncbi:hypothetical protein B0O80DRAFT_423212 [Mortierella sp. GBAus27b]|nr:hypothetical protein B0O80DRAFT_423212 [Mortierella sp. GBAus27b]
MDIEAINEELREIERFFQNHNIPSSTSPLEVCASRVPLFLDFNDRCQILSTSLASSSAANITNDRTGASRSERTVADLKERYKHLKATQGQLQLELTRARIQNFTKQQDHDQHLTKQQEQIQPSQTQQQRLTRRQQKQKKQSGRNRHQQSQSTQQQRTQLHFSDGYTVSLLPAPPKPRLQSMYGIIKFDFNARTKDELDVRAEDHVLITEEFNGKFYVAKPLGRFGKSGLIPVDCVMIRDIITRVPITLQEVYRQQQEQQYQHQRGLCCHRQLSTVSQTPIFQPLFGIALYDFSSRTEDELDVKFGDPILVIGQLSEDWYLAMHMGRSGRIGVIPKTFVELRDMKTRMPVNVNDVLQMAPTTLSSVELQRQCYGLCCYGPHGGLRSRGQAFMPPYGIVKFDTEDSKVGALTARIGDPVLIIGRSQDGRYMVEPIGRLGGPGLIQEFLVEIRDMMDKPIEAINKELREIERFFESFYTSESGTLPEAYTPGILPFLNLSRGYHASSRSSTSSSTTNSATEGISASDSERYVADLKARYKQLKAAQDQLHLSSMATQPGQQFSQHDHDHQDSHEYQGSRDYHEQHQTQQKGQQQYTPSVSNGQASSSTAPENQRQQQKGKQKKQEPWQHEGQHQEPPPQEIGRLGIPVPPKPTFLPLYGTVSKKFDARMCRELDVRIGEKIVVIGQPHRDWFLVRRTTRPGESGWIPVSYVTIRDMATGKPTTQQEEQHRQRERELHQVKQLAQLREERRNSGYCSCCFEFLGWTMPRLFAVVRYDFDGNDPIAIDVKIGEYLLVVDQIDEWYLTRPNGRIGSGIVPVSYVEIRDMDTLEPMKLDEIPVPVLPSTDDAVKQQQGQEEQKQRQQRHQQEMKEPEQQQQGQQTREQQQLARATVTRSWSPPMGKHDLFFRANDPILIIDRPNADWYVAKHLRKRGRPGLVPASYVRVGMELTVKSMDPDKMVQEAYHNLCEEDFNVRYEETAWSIGHYVYVQLDPPTGLNPPTGPTSCEALSLVLIFLLAYWCYTLYH